MLPANKNVVFYWGRGLPNETARFYSDGRTGLKVSRLAAEENKISTMYKNEEEPKKIQTVLGKSQENGNSTKTK